MEVTLLVRFQQGVQIWKKAVRRWPFSSATMALPPMGLGIAVIVIDGSWEAETFARPVIG